MGNSTITFSLGLGCDHDIGMPFLAYPMIAPCICQGLFALLVGTEWSWLCLNSEFLNEVFPVFVIFLGIFLSSLVELHTTHTQIGIWPETQEGLFYRFLKHFLCVAFSFVVLCSADSLLLQGPIDSVLALQLRFFLVGSSFFLLVLGRKLENYRTCFIYFPSFRDYVPILPVT